MQPEQQRKYYCDWYGCCLWSAACDVSVARRDRIARIRNHSDEISREWHIRLVSSSSNEADSHAIREEHTAVLRGISRDSRRTSAARLRRVSRQSSLDHIAFPSPRSALSSTPVREDQHCVDRYLNKRRGR